MYQIILWMLVVIPTLIFPSLVIDFQRVLNQKRRDIDSLMSRGNALKTYIQAFTTAPSEEHKKTPIDDFYGWRTYIVPVFASVTTTAIAAIIIVERTGLSLGLPSELEDLIRKTPEAVLAALVGAYLWVVIEAIGRFRVVDLPAYSIHEMWLRMVAAATFGWLTTKTLLPPLDVWVALGIGAFPLRSLLNFAKAQTRNRLDLAGPDAGESPNVYVLQGATPKVVERLSEEGYESVEHLAYADPIKLLFKTNLEWKMILDLIDQSILMTYFLRNENVSSDNISSLRMIGVRGAIELSKIGTSAAKTEPKEEVEAMLNLVSSKLEIDVAGLMYVQRTLARDPQVGLIATFWGEAFVEENQN